jgi:hypothetical protein
MAKLGVPGEISSQSDYVDVAGGQVDQPFLGSLMPSPV